MTDIKEQNALKDIEYHYARGGCSSYPCSEEQPEQLHLISTLFTESLAQKHRVRLC